MPNPAPSPGSAPLSPAPHRRPPSLLAPLLGVALAVGLGAGLNAGCAGTDQQMDLSKELELAKANASKRKQAECYPGHKEPCYDGPDGTASRGICTEGVKTCDPDGFWLACEGAVPPESKETCNGKDDDCNGVVDDGFPRAGSKCTIGKGMCRSEGTYSCAADGSAASCSATVIQPGAEICDGKDNDCNGVVDDGDIKGTGASCSTGQKGVCAKGHKKCDVGKISCMPDKPASVELCNNLDDDCDGQTDEDCITEDEARKAGLLN